MPLNAVKVLETQGSPRHHDRPEEPTPHDHACDVASWVGSETGEGRSESRVDISQYASVNSSIVTDVKAMCT